MRQRVGLPPLTRIAIAHVRTPLGAAYRIKATEGAGNAEYDGFSTS
jgi:hypothetical protein